MNRFSFFCIALTALFVTGAKITFSQNTDALKLTKIVLDNGLTVLLNEDHSEPKVMGSIAVRAGSKNDPPDATGIAHYFEHIMFKGTDSIGTIDYQKEKIYLDSISMMYDKLGATTDAKQRKALLGLINDLTIKSAQYAIPNETDKILKKYGSTGLNAGTSFEQTVYYNTFPPEQIERWLAIYSERFRNPVFRLFQSELETVYEEQNMYADQMGHAFQEEILSKIFQKHPYGQRPVIGTVEHLKNPSLSKMGQFYKDFYVANNMALVLTGDFDAQAIIPIIKKRFGGLASGNVPAFDHALYKEAPFRGREFYTAKLMPLRIEVMAFRGVPNHHDDEQKIQLCLNILSNEDGTGILDQLKAQNIVMEVQAESVQLNDEGAVLFIIIPKVVGGKSMEEIESLVMAGIDSLKAGKFDDEMVQSLKLKYRKQHTLELENCAERGQLILSTFLNGYSWDEILSSADHYDNISRQDIMDAAGKYFSTNRMVFYNKRGLPKKGNKIQKPTFKPIPALNTLRQSEFAKALDNIATPSAEPRYIDFGHDFSKSQICQGVSLYSVPNPVNDIFTLTLSFGIGKLSDKKLGPMADIIKELGTQDKTSQELKKEMQKVGTSCEFECTENQFKIKATGFDSNLEKSIALIAEILSGLKPDDAQMEKLAEGIKGEEKMAKKDQNTITDAMLNYVQYKNQSPYLDRITLADIKKMNTAELIEALKQVLKYQTDVYYVGKLDPDTVGQWVKKYIPFAPVLAPRKDELLHVLPYANNQVFLFDNPKAIQSSINVLSAGGATDRVEKLKAGLFSEYFGRGMSSIVFQEIREFRSLAYGAAATFICYPNRFPNEKGYLRGYLTTQSDKTVDAITAFDSLITFMPVRPQRLEIIKQSYKESVNSLQPNFRALPSTVASWMYDGYTQDPRKEKYDFLRQSSFDDISSFYQKFVQDKPKVYIVTGKGKSINTGALEKFGDINRLKIKDIMRF